MQPNIFQDAEQPATLADIQAIEQRYEFTLPDDYKTHMLQHNGGWPERDTFLQRRENGRITERTVNQFKPIAHGEYTLESSLEALRDQLHPDLVAFADEGGGD